jgi:outer membrane lipoprotein-sorting protein
VVWGKIVGWIETEFSTPLLQEFYDEDGEKLRIMHFGDIREVQGRHVPHLWSITPLGKPGHRTRIQIHEIRFDVSFDESIFTTRHLKKRD